MHVQYTLQGLSYYVVAIPGCLLLIKASRDTIRRWIQQIMIKAGIDINVYKPHSVGSAATSKAKAANASLVEIMQTAGWSSAATFAKFYDREIEQGSLFADSVLSQS